MPRVLVAGPAGTYPAEGYHPITHGSHVRPLGIARALASVGCGVDLLDQHGHASVRGVTDEDLVGHLADYDAICIAGIAGLWRLRAGGHEAPLLAHPRVALMVDTVYGAPDAISDLGFARKLIATSPAVAEFYAPHRPAGLTAYAPWGCSELPPAPSPWPDERPRVLFAGIVHERFIGVLNALAEALPVEVWAAGIFSVDGVFGGLTSEQRGARLHPRLRLATDVLPQTSMGQGPVVYSDCARMMQHATVGVNLVPRANHATMGTSCKVYDYLGAGLRIVSEPSPACDDDIEALHAGVVVPWGDTPAMVQAVGDLVRGGAVAGRSDLAARALERCSWRRTAEIVVSMLGAP